MGVGACYWSAAACVALGRSGRVCCACLVGVFGGGFVGVLFACIVRGGALLPFVGVWGWGRSCGGGRGAGRVAGGLGVFRLAGEGGGAWGSVVGEAVVDRAGVVYHVVMVGRRVSGVGGIGRGGLRRVIGGDV